MLKFTKSKRPKGQWFLISIVIISYSLLSIYSVMYSFLGNKYFWNLVNNNKGYTMRNINDYLKSTMNYQKSDVDINESIYFIEKNLAERGVYANITYGHNADGSIWYDVNILNS